LIVDDEYRNDWWPGHSPYGILCRSRKLIPKAKYWIETFKRDSDNIRQLKKALKSTPLTSEAIELINAPMNQLNKIVKRVESDYPSKTPSK